VQTRASGDFRKRKTLSLQEQNLAMSWRAFLQHKLPELVTLRDLARTRLIGVGQLFRVKLVEGAFLLQGSVVLASAINESVAGYLHQKGPQVRAIGEPPSCLAKTAQNIGPDRLNDVHRVQLGPQRAGQLAPDCHPKIRFIREKCALGGSDIATVQPLDQLIQMVDAHVKLVDQLPGSSG
jgi:hypothetical protein